MECISIFFKAHTFQYCGWLIFITLPLMVTVVTVITAYLYLRCCCFLSSDCLICEVNIQLNSGAGRKLSIIERGGGLGEFQIIFNLLVFKNSVIEVFR